MLPFLVELVPEISVAALSIFYSSVMKVFVELNYFSIIVFLSVGFSYCFLNPYYPWSEKAKQTASV